MPPKKTKGEKDKSETEVESDTQMLILKKMEELGSKMNSMQESLNNLTEEFNSFKELKEEVKEIKQVADCALEHTENNAEELSRLNNELKTAHEAIATLKTCCTNLNDSIIQQDTYSRRDNLLFECVPEAPKEDCADIMKKFFVESLNMSPDRVAQIKIVRCHRLGKPKSGLTRTIICRFHYFGDRQDVWNERRNLKGSNYRMNEDFPKQITAKRNILAPIMYEARRQDMRANLVVDTLYIDNKAYTVDTLNSLPASLDISKMGTKKISENLVAFFGANSPLSNFYYAPFTDGKITFFGTEQYLHYHKATLFKDTPSAAKILAAKTPLECKDLGSKIENFDHDIWKQRAKDIMRVGQVLKFRQNSLCFKALEATGNHELVEASPRDRLWGAACGMKDPDLKNKQLWKGSNWMGEILQSVRAELIG